MATITFDLPDDVEKHLATLSGSVDAAAKEAAVVELYRQGQISHGALAECLGVSRTDADAVLERHGVTEDLPTIDDFLAEVQALRARLRP
jgi:predicted HTH domain antitoxin